MRILAIGAHPDDIEIACSGTLAKCVKYVKFVCVNVVNWFFHNLYLAFRRNYIKNYADCQVERSQAEPIKPFEEKIVHVTSKNPEEFYVEAWNKK